MKSDAQALSERRMQKKSCQDNSVYFRIRRISTAVACCIVSFFPLFAQFPHLQESQTSLMVTSVLPARNSVIAQPTTSITATFSDAVSQSSITGSTFVVSGSLTGRHQGQIALDASGKVASFTPTAK